MVSYFFLLAIITWSYMKKTTVIFEEVFTVRKLLLVVLIGIVLALDVFGVAKEIVTFIEEQKLDEMDTNPPGTTIVYVEE